MIWLVTVYSAGYTVDMVPTCVTALVLLLAGSVVPISRRSEYNVGLLCSYGYATSRQCCTYLMQLRAIVLGCYEAMAMPLGGSVVPISCSSELWSHQTVCIKHTIFF